VTVSIPYSAASAFHGEADSDRKSRLPALRLFRELGRIEPPDRLVHKLLGVTSLAVVFGPPGCGKTFFALQLGCSVADGSDFLGRRVTQGGVLYIAAEAGGSFHNRVAAFKAHHALSDNLPFAAWLAPVDLGAREGDAKRIIEAAAVVADIWAQPVLLIVIDTLNRSLGGADENSSEAMGTLIGNVDRIRTETGATVCLIHHGGKDGARGPRGHSSLFGAADTVIEVETRESGRVAIVRKARDLEGGIEIGFDLDPVQIGLDDEGEPITSCVVIPTDASPSESKRPLSATQHRALECLREAIAREGAVPASNNHIPSGKPVVAVRAWRDLFYSRTLGSEKPEAKQKAFRRATDILISAGRVGIWQEQAWLIG